MVEAVRLPGSPHTSREDLLNDQAFVELCSRRRTDLVGLCGGLLGPEGDAESAAQDALVRAWLSIDRYSPDRPFWPWLSTIARRICIDQLRRRRCQEAHVYEEYRWQASPPDEPEFEAERQEEQQTALQALKFLRPREQRLIGRRHIDGWLVERLADFEGLSVDATRTALKRAQAALRVRYERLMTSRPALVLLGLVARIRRRLVLGASKVRPNEPMFMAARSTELLVAVLALVASPLGTDGGGTTVTVGGPAPLAPTAAPTTVESIPAAPAAPTTLPAGSPRPAGGTTTTTKRSANRPSNGGSTDDGGTPFAFDRVASPEDAWITGFTYSPDYQRDGVVFADGHAGNGCTTLACDVLFRSDDYGASWSRLPASNFGGGRILLSPAFPADDRIFAAGPNVFQVSTDGGKTFEPVGTTGGGAAMSPGFASGDGRILIGSSPRWVYNDAEHSARPSEMVVTSTSVTGTPEFAPDVVDGSVLFIGGTTPTAEYVNASTIFECDRSSCHAGAVLPHLVGSPSLRLSPSFRTTGEAWAWRGAELFRSDDGGHNFSHAALPPASAAIRDFQFGAGSLRYAATVGANGSGALLRSTDRGASWSPIYQRGVEAFAVLPDGRLLIGLQSEMGLACSNDGGATWFKRC